MFISFFNNSFIISNLTQVINKKGEQNNSEKTLGQNKLSLDESIR